MPPKHNTKPNMQVFTHHPDFSSTSGVSHSVNFVYFTLSLQAIVSSVIQPFTSQHRTHATRRSHVVPPSRRFPTMIISVVAPGVFGDGTDNVVVEEDLLTFLVVVLPVLWTGCVTPGLISNYPVSRKGAYCAYSATLESVANVSDDWPQGRGSVANGINIVMIRKLGRRNNLRSAPAPDAAAGACKKYSDHRARHLSETFCLSDLAFQPTAYNLSILRPVGSW
ncbi:uncharacterized protein GGS22DRAFT_189379 [Annulohypoxylon maeteangense]|uniref:uncharacterized protein n=1 Tax=Annulohypoxylon maeteangense TaxID=1927788 RepID=UPI00200847B1|nr:uncharacterized protein GGS22DRAFT_189379 [Annulohypoxylon maeteangense]KAI0884248.1 hypothetical protein GGS22DRAFT_189379 [Annulohypoxylon maeteangense]